MWICASLRLDRDRVREIDAAFGERRHAYDPLLAAVGNTAQGGATLAAARAASGRSVRLAQKRLMAAAQHSRTGQSDCVHSCALIALPYIYLHTNNVEVP